MKRSVEPIQYVDADARVRAVYDDILKTFGKTEVPNLFKIMAGIGPGRLEATWTKYKASACTSERIPAMLGQLSLFLLAIHTGNRYCIAAHAYNALHMDDSLTYDDLLNLVEGQAYEELPTSFQAALDFVRRVTSELSCLEDSDYDYVVELNRAGFSNAEIDELTAQLDAGMMLSSFCAMYEIPLEEPEYWLGAVPRPEQLVRPARRSA